MRRWEENVQQVGVFVVDRRMKSHYSVQKYVQLTAFQKNKKVGLIMIFHQERCTKTESGAGGLWTSCVFGSVCAWIAWEWELHAAYFGFEWETKSIEKYLYQYCSASGGWGWNISENNGGRSPRFPTLPSDWCSKKILSNRLSNKGHQHLFA